MNAAVALERTETLTAPTSPEDVRRLRHEVALILAEWGVTKRAEDVLIACSELLTNALRYGQTPLLTVNLVERDGCLRVSVPDCNPFPPYPATADRDDEDGRGVYLLAVLADAWGFRAHGTGKDVFAEFRTDGDPP